MVDVILYRKQSVLTFNRCNTMATVITHEEAVEIFAKLEEIQKRLDQLQNQQTGTTCDGDETCDFERAREILGRGKKMPASTLYSYTSQKLIPHYKDKAGRRLYFKRSDLEAFALSHRIATEEEIQQRAATALMRMKK